MAGGVVTITQFQGLNYAQDPRQFKAPGLIHGQNVLINAEGVFSAFAEEFVSEAIVADPNRIQTFRVEGYILECAVGVIQRYDPSTDRYYAVFTFDDDDEPYPWSAALVGGVYYFAKFGVGLISYNPNTYKWKLEDVSSDIPDDIYGVCTARGRLCIQSRNLSSYSAIDAGTNLTPSPTTGANQQSMSICGGGIPLGIFQTVAGFIAFTKTGCAAFTLVNAVIPFRFRRVETLQLPVNPWAVTTIQQGEVVYVAKVGMLTTKGDLPIPYQPLFSEYLTQKLFKEIDLSTQTILRLSYNEDRQWLLLSVSSAANPFVYYKAFCLYLPLDQWGVFNEQHYGFGEFDLGAGPYSGYNFGYIDADGRTHRFIDIPRREETAQTDDTIYYRPDLDIPTRCDDSGVAPIYYFGVMMTFYDINPSVFNEVPGVYSITPQGEVGQEPEPIVAPADVANDTDVSLGEDWGAGPTPDEDEDWETASGDEDYGVDDAYYAVFGAGAGTADNLIISTYGLVASNYTSINSFADLGLMRLTDAQFADQLSNMQLLSIGSGLQAIFQSVDFETTDELDEDWDVVSGDEDWGNDLPTGNMFSVFAQGTIDGKNTFEDQEATLVTSYQAGESIMYPMNLSGIYHRFRISATEPNESFHLKTTELAGILAGRLH